MKNNINAYGSKERRQKRKLHIIAIHKHVNYLIAHFMPELNKQIVNIQKDRYFTQLALLIDALEKKYTSFYDYRIANNYLATFINDGNKTKKWLLDVPEFIVSKTRERPLRSEKLFIGSRDLNKWEKQWRQYLSTKPSNQSKVTEEELSVAVMISATLYGGLCIPNALVALANQLRADSKPLLFDGKRYWIDLVYNSKSQATNVIIDENPYTLRRWYPDPVSLAWIHNLLTSRAFSLKKSQPLPPESYWKKIKDYLVVIDKDIGGNFKNFKLFCNASIGVVENYNGVNLSEALAEYALGIVPSASLPSGYHDLITQNPALKSIKCQSLNAFKRAPANKKSTSMSSSKNDHYESIISNIREAIKPKISLGRKSTPARALAKLEVLHNLPLSLPLRILVSWFEYLLKEKNIKVSSTNQYFSLIGKDWILATINQDLYAFDELDFQGLYKLMLDSETMNEKILQKVDCFERFHRFAHRRFDLELMDSIYPTNTIKKKKSYVRAGYVPEHAFIIFCKSLQDAEYNDRHAKAGLEILFLLAFRTGLRRGELLKLRIKDVQSSTECWIYVRNNRFGDNKSSSGSRKIPLSLLLTIEEKAQFDIYLSERNLLTKFKSKALLFSLSQTPYIPFDGHWVSLIAKHFLQEITGLSFVFHHFRHTALSRLQVVLEGDEELTKLLSPYSQIQMKNIQSCLGSLDKPQNRRDVYWVLAGIAGHLTPETTFANYLHFSDRLLINKIEKAEIKFSASAIKEISGLTRHAITRCCNSKSLNSDDLKIQYFQAPIINNLNKFGRTIKVAKIPKIKKENFDNRIKKKPTIEICHAVLKHAEEGATSYELATRFWQYEEYINSWIFNAQNIANLKTSKNKSRLFSRDKAITIIGEPLAPSMPQSTAELIDANKAINVLRSFYKKQEQNIKWCVRYYLRNTHTSSSGLIFHNPKDLKRFLKLMLNIFPNKRWHFRLKLLKFSPQNEQMKEWKTVCQMCDLKILPETVRQKETFPHGRLELYLTHPLEQKIIQASEIKAKEINTKPYKKYSSNTMRYIFHMIAIMRS